VALQQTQVVRLLAYSGIAQAGYILLTFALVTDDQATNATAFQAAVVYILIYGIMTIGAFAVAVAVSRRHPTLRLDDFGGLAKTAPILAVGMTVFMISLAGVPPTGGFWAKILIFRAAIDRGGSLGIWLAVLMLVNSVKPLDEIRQGDMLALPKLFTLEPWASAWSTAQIGVQPTGLRPYFLNSIIMVVPAVAASTLLGALNGYVLTKWRFPGDNLVFTLMLLSCFIPFQIVLIPMAKVLGLLGLAGTTWGLSLVHAIYGIGFTTLFFRNYYEAFPTELVRAAMIDGASFFQIFRRIMLPNSLPIFVVTVIFQFTNIWNDFLFASAYAGTGDRMPMTVALNNVVNTSTGVVEYNVNMAAAMIAALPTLLVYVLAGRYFVRGLMAGAVKG